MAGSPSSLLYILPAFQKSREALYGASREAAEVSEA